MGWDWEDLLSLFEKIQNFMLFFSQYEFPVVFCHNYMASSASGAPCFCPLSQGRFIAAFFPSVGALHPALSFVVPTPSLHLTLSYPALASPMQLDHYSSEMWTHGLHRKIFHISYLVLISPSRSSPWEHYTQRCHLLSQHPLCISPSYPIFWLWPTYWPMLSAGAKYPVLPFEFKTDVLNYWQIKIFIEGFHSYLDVEEHFRSAIVFSFLSMDPKISQRRCKSVKNVVDLPSDVVVRHCLWVTGCLPVVVMAKGDMQHCTVLAFSTNPRFLLVHLIVLSCKSLVAWKSQYGENIIQLFHPTNPR